jgi:hypothetical protein
MWITVLLVLSAHQGYAYTTHTVFTTECTPYFTWQSIGTFLQAILPSPLLSCPSILFWILSTDLPCAGFMLSYRLAGQTGKVTRLMSCTEEGLKSFKDDRIMPTHIAPSWTKHPITGDLYRWCWSCGAVISYSGKHLACTSKKVYVGL